MLAKKVLLTGGAGYIGAHTATELLQSGYDVVLVDNFSKSDDTLLKGIEKILDKKPVFFEGDCKDAQFLKKIFSQNKFDSVIHFAAYKSVSESVREPLAYYENNLGSMIELLRVMKKFEVNKFIFSSSCAPLRLFFGLLRWLSWPPEACS